MGEEITIEIIRKALEKIENPIIRINERDLESLKEFVNKPPKSFMGIPIIIDDSLESDEWYLK